MKKKIIYIAGPYRANTEYGVHQNIQDAEKVCARILLAGGNPICPHKNTGYLGDLVHYDEFIENGIQIISKCNAVFAMPGHAGSEGATRELAAASDLHIPIFTSFDEAFFEFLGKQVLKPVGAT